MLTAFEAREIARSRGLNAADPSVISSIMAGAQEGGSAGISPVGSIGAPSMGGFSYSGPSGSAVVDLLNQAIVDPVRRDISSSLGGGGLPFPASLFRGIAELPRSAWNMLTAPVPGLRTMTPSGEQEVPPMSKKPHDLRGLPGSELSQPQAGKRMTLADMLEDMMRTSLPSTGVPEDRPVPQMALPGIPDYSTAQRIMEQAAPAPPRTPSKGEERMRWLGAMAGGAGQGLQQMNLASILTGAGAAGAETLGAMADKARVAEQLYQQQKAQHGRARSLMEMGISDRIAAAEAQRAQVDFKNNLMVYAHQRERDKLLAGGLRFVGNQAIYSFYDSKTGKMGHEAIQMNQVDTFLNMMKIQAAFAAAGKGKNEKLQAGSYEIAMSMFRHAPHLVIPATLAALTVSGVIGGDLGPMFQDKVEQQLDAMGLDHKMLRQQEGEEGYRTALDRMLFNVIMQTITSPTGDSIFGQLLSELQGGTSYVAPREE